MGARLVTTSRLKAYGALAGMFVLGAVSSAAAYHAFARRQYAELFSGDRSTFEARLVEALGRDLELRDAQLAQVRGIFQKHAAERRRLFRQEVETCGGPMTQHRERVDAEIRALLDPAQRARFETLRAERRRKLFGDPEPSPRASP
jgi:Spy/CpxP family protein refolding chaperone